MNRSLRDHKRRGEWVELCFAAQAASHGFSVSKPWGETSPYDVSIEKHGRFQRIQVKSTMYKVGRSYVCNIRANDKKRLYTMKQLDVMALYMIPEKTWYILPAKIVLKLRGNIWLSPHKHDHKYRDYMEAWHLLDKH